MLVEPKPRALSTSVAEAFLHEARNAVFGLSVTLDAMQEDEAPGAALAEHATTLLGCAGRATRLMHDLVAYLEPPTPVRSQLDLPASLRAVVEEVRPALGERGFRLHVPEDALPAPCVGDPHLVHRALCALIQGVAIVAGRDADVVVSLAARRDRSRSFLEVCISAEQAEVAPERVATFFEPFAVRGPHLTGFSVALAKRSLAAQDVTVVVEQPREGALVARIVFPLG